MNAITALKGFLDEYYNDIMNYAKQYYQYKQFKKAYFDCDKIDYDKSTGRIKLLEFTYTEIGD